MNKRGMDDMLIKIAVLILFLVVMFVVYYFYKTKLAGGLFKF